MCAASCEDEGSGSYGSPMEHEREAQGRAEGQWQRKELSNITLAELEKHYDVPLIEVARKLSVSLTMLKKLCRKHGITRWPHRQIRSIANNIEELKGRYLKCQSDNERRRLDEQIDALHKKRRLVYRSASCGLNAALRNAIFQARPGELDEEALFDQGLLPNLKAALSTKKKSSSSKASSNSSGQQSDCFGSRSLLPDKRKRDEELVFQNPFQEPADLVKNFSSSQLSMSSDTPSDSNHPAAKMNVRSITSYGAPCVETSRGQGFPNASPSFMQCPFDMASTTSRAQQHYPHMLHLTNQQPVVPSISEQNMRYSLSGTGAYHSSVPQSVSNRQQNHFLMLPMDVFQHLSQQHPPLQPPAGNHPFHQLPHLHQLARTQHQDPLQYPGPQQTSLPSTGYGFRSSHNILMHDAESVRQQHQDALNVALAEYSPLDDMFDTADDTYEYDERLERSLAEEYRQNACSNTIQPFDSLRCDSRGLDLMSIGHFRQDLGVDNSDVSGSMEPSRRLAI